MTFHFKNDLYSEICPNTECNMSNFIAAFLKVIRFGNNQVRWMNHHRARVELLAESVVSTAEPNLIN